MSYIERETLRDTLYEADAITMKGVAIINQFPAADVAPVVRCRECKHYNTTGYPALNPGTGWCEDMGKGVSDDFYCSYGERRESEAGR